MTSVELFALYDRFAEAPNAVARLRRFILDLAVRGKLVPQDPAEGNAIKFDRELAVGAGQPFQIPPSWVWVRFHTLGSITGGGTPSKFVDEYWNGSIPWVSPKDMKRNYIDGAQLSITEEAIARSAANLIQVGSVLFVVRGMILSHSFPVALSQVPLAINQDMKALTLKRPEMAEYVLRALKGITPEILRCVQRSSHGTCRLEGSAYRDILFPVPPLAEQRRIVAKVDELMGLCDRLEEARTRREAHRARLTTASLSRLTAPDTDAQTFQSHARFALDTLPALTTRPDQIKALRQTILCLAVRGRLVAQDPTDEPAEKLLRRLQKEISAYCSFNRISAARPDPIGSDNLPFVPPPGWRWTRLSALFKVITDGDHQPPPKSDEGVAFLTIGNITTGRLDFTDCRLVPDSYYRALAAYRTPAKGDILYTVVGATYGRPAVVYTEREFCVQRHIAIMKPATEMVIGYLALLLASPLVYEQASRSTTGTAQPTIALRPLRNFLVPLPPLPEQHRIVAKVDALMKLCDQLEVALTTADTTRRRLLEAVLHEALAPAEDALEAAQ